VLSPSMLDGEIAARSSRQPARQLCAAACLTSVSFQLLLTWLCEKDGFFVERLRAIKLVVLSLQIILIVMQNKMRCVQTQTQQASLNAIKTVIMHILIYIEALMLNERTLSE
jgi:hypothetical protein